MVMTIQANNQHSMTIIQPEGRFGVFDHIYGLGKWFLIISPGPGNGQRKWDNNMHCHCDFRCDSYFLFRFHKTNRYCNCQNFPDKPLYCNNCSDSETTLCSRPVSKESLIQQQLVKLAFTQFTQLCPRHPYKVYKYI